jgi:hypothetical protein
MMNLEIAISVVCGLLCLIFALHYAYMRMYYRRKRMQRDKDMAHWTLYDKDADIEIKYQGPTSPEEYRYSNPFKRAGESVQFEPYESFEDVQC